MSYRHTTDPTLSRQLRAVMHHFTAVISCERTWTLDDYVVNGMYFIWFKCLFLLDFTIVTTKYLLRLLWLSMGHYEAS